MFSNIMKSTFLIGSILISLLALTGCGEDKAVEQKTAPKAGAKSVNVPPPAPKADPSPPLEVYKYNPSGKRDPFRSLLVVQEKAPGQRKEDLPPLQRYGVQEFVLSGITWDAKGAIAVVRAPDGKGYILKKGIYMGPNKGIITKITPSNVVVLEKITNYKGKEESREVILELHSPEEDRK